MSAYYLKYRPQSLTDLIGQEVVKKTLLSAFEADKLSHGYLFVGPRGTGKTSTARILAKMVNCESQESRVKSQGKENSRLSTLATRDLPCNKCSNCISITDGSNLDLIEIDAASNRGIEDIRALREKIKLSPTTSKKKVYIIDEVHMLTTEAFNALLKTLEEPPAHVLFILATTDASKLPATILSRVQRLNFKLARPSELLEALQKIVKAEKIDIDESALRLLVNKSDGSFRDGVKLLDQVSTMEGKITAEILEKSLKSSNFEENLSLLQSISQKDTKASLQWIIKQTEEGIDIKDLILSLMDNLRSLIFIKNGLGAELVEPNLMEENYQKLVEISQKFTNQDLVKLLDGLQKALEKMKTTSIPSLPLEIAVVEMTQSVILSEQSESKDLPRMRVPNESRDSSLIVQNDKIEVLPEKTELAGPRTDVQNPSADFLILKEKWTFVLETVRPFNFSLEALLRSIKVRECTKTDVIMEVPYSFHQRILEAPKNRDMLESIFSDILGRVVKLSIILGGRPGRREDIANIEIAADDEIIRAAAEIFNSDSIN